MSSIIAAPFQRGRLHKDAGRRSQPIVLDPRKRLNRRERGSAGITGGAQLTITPIRIGDSGEKATGPQSPRPDSKLEIEAASDQVWPATARIRIGRESVIRTARIG